MDINYELYKVFYHVAKTLSFSDASKELFISQSAVSQSVKVLEKRLNQTLFFRSTKKVALTKEGEMLFKYIEPAINLIYLGEKQILESHSFHGGQLRVGASDTICRYFLVPYLSEFHNIYPNIHIKVMNGTSFQCVDLLESGKVDLIVTNFPNHRLSAIRSIRSIKIFHDCFIANSSFFPELYEKQVSLAELLKYPVLMLDKQSTTSDFLHHLFLQRQLELAPAIELSSNDLLIDLAKIGLGIAFVPDFCMTGNSHSLFMIQLSEELPSRKLVVAYNDRIPLTGAAEFFINCLLSSHK